MSTAPRETSAFVYRVVSIGIFAFGSQSFGVEFDSIAYTWGVEMRNKLFRHENNSRQEKKKVQMRDASHFVNNLKGITMV